MITHDVEEAIFLSQRIYAMSPCPGRIEKEIHIALPTYRVIDIKLSLDFLEIKRRIIQILREGS